MPAVSYGCKTRSLKLREKHRLGVSENGMPKKICGSKRKEIPGAWRKLRNEELHDRY